MKKVLKIIFLIVVIIININIVYAIDYNQIYDPINHLTGSHSVAYYQAGGKIAGWVKYGGVCVCVIVLMGKGIKFVTSSPEGKADAKKELIPWAIGTIMLFSITIIIDFIVKFAQDNVNNM